MTEPRNRRFLTTRADISLQVLIVNICISIVFGVILGGVCGAALGLFDHKVLETLGKGVVLGAALGAIAGLAMAAEGPKTHSDAPVLAEVEDEDV